MKELLSERADSDVEPCPWCLGDTSAESAMRALGAVLADLAEIGFDAEWVSVPAASAGACHLRWRVFILAWPAADAGSDSRPGNRTAVAVNGAGARTGPILPSAIGIAPADPRASANENRQTKRTPSQEAGEHGLCLAAKCSSCWGGTYCRPRARGRNRAVEHHGRNARPLNEVIETGLCRRRWHRRGSSSARAMRIAGRTARTAEPSAGRGCLRRPRRHPVARRQGQPAPVAAVFRMDDGPA